MTRRRICDQRGDPLIARWESPPDEIQTPDREGEAWQDWLARHARASRQCLLAHRDGARVVASAAWLSPATIRMFNAELAALVGCGFTPVLALRTLTAVSRYATGFVFQEQAHPGARAEQPPDPSPQ